MEEVVELDLTAQSSGPGEDGGDGPSSKWHFLNSTLYGKDWAFQKMRATVCWGGGGQRQGVEGGGSLALKGLGCPAKDFEFYKQQGYMEFKKQ